MKKIYYAALVIFLLFSTRLATADETSSLNIGFILPLSGPAASWGENTRNGALLALGSLPQADAQRISLFFEDDQLKGALAVTAFQKLSNKKLDLAVLFGGQSASAVIPIAERAKIPTISITAQSGPIEGRQFALRHWIDSKVQSQLIISYLLHKNQKRVAVIAATTEGTLDMVKVFVTQAEQSGVTISYREDLVAEERDFRLQIMRIRQSGAAAIVMALLPGQISTFARQKADLKLDLPLYGFTPSENSNEVAAAGSALEGLTYVGADYTDSFVRKYQTRFGKYPELASGNGYDVVLMVAQALENSVRNGEELIRFIRSLDQISGSMKPYRLGPNNSFLVPAILKRVEGSKFVKVVD